MQVLLRMNYRSRPIHLILYDSVVIALLAMQLALLAVRASATVSLAI